MRLLLKTVCWFCIIISTCLLSACMDVATTGASAIYNRHAWQKNINDQLITLRTYRSLFDTTKDFKDSNITVAALNGEVLLAGQVPQEWQKHRAEQLTKRIPNVLEVHNYLTIASPSSSITRVSDTWITTKVKSHMMLSEDFDATQLKVITENGTVYIMGMLFEDEAKSAVEIAKNTYGVQDVVKVFSILHATRPEHPRIYS